MKILIICKDETLFDENSRGFKELSDASQLTEQLHVIVLTKNFSNFKIKNLGGKIFLYPTKLGFGFLGSRNALKMAELQLSLSGQAVFDLTVADDPFESALGAYLISRKFKKNFIVNVYKDLYSLLSKENNLVSITKIYIANYVLTRARAIRVASQLVGESVSAELPGLENRIFILPAISEIANTVHGDKNTVSLDIRSKYPQFNVFILAVMEPYKKDIVNRLDEIMKNLRLRYPRIGLLLISDGIGVFKLNKSPYIAYEKSVDDIVSYFKSVNLFIDISKESKPGQALTQAALSGCPIVAARSPASDYIIKDGENGFIADPSNMADFSGRIVELLETPGLSQKIKLMRYEVDEIHANNTEDYWKALGEMWKVNSVQLANEEIEDDTLESYTTDLVHTLKYTRDFANKVQRKIMKAGSDVAKKVSTRNRKPRTALSIHDENEVFDIDSIV